MQIAKSNLSFAYSAKLRALKSYESLLKCMEPSSGAELAFNEFAKQQFLRNSRLLKKPFFEVDMKVWPRKVFEGKRVSVVSCQCDYRQLQRLKLLLQEFEEAHNAIAMKIFWPTRDHYPLTEHNSRVYLITSAETDLFEKQRVFRATFRVRFHVSRLRYRFTFVATRFVAVA